MKFSLKLVNSDSDISKQILNGLKKQAQSALNKSKQDINDALKSLVKQFIQAEPEYRSLLGGELKYQLGVPDAGIVDQIVNIWSNNIKIINNKVNSTSNGLRGGFSVSMIKSDYSDVLSSSAAKIKDSSTGSVVPWLEWLLLRGGDVLIKDYEIQIGPNPRSRTGMAIMVSSKSNYRLPAKFAGTESNNWVYRAISKIDDATMQNIVKRALEKNL
tara:strand:+ start:5313 stop:5957 length:645 start_codon:yes stop_codon:yes gene_type:complete